jgi:hypothetical protein
MWVVLWCAALTLGPVAVGWWSIRTPPSSVVPSSASADVEAYFVSRSGTTRRLKACCPYHGERTPSLLIGPIEGGATAADWRCFGCGRRGRALSLTGYAQRHGQSEMWMLSGPSTTPPRKVSP